MQSKKFLELGRKINDFGLSPDDGKCHEIFSKRDFADSKIICSTSLKSFEIVNKFKSILGSFLMDSCFSKRN